LSSVQGAITLDLSNTGLFVNERIFTSGRINFSNGTNLTNYAINISINGTLLNGSLTDNGGNYNVSVNVPQANGEFAVKVNLTYNSQTWSQTKNLNVTGHSNYTNFNGSTTAFNTLGTGIQDVANAILERLPYGKIAWMVTHCNA